VTDRSTAGEFEVAVLPDEQPAPANSRANDAATSFFTRRPFRSIRTLIDRNIRCLEKTRLKTVGLGLSGELCPGPGTTQVGGRRDGVALRPGGPGPLRGTGGFPTPGTG